MVSCIEPGAVTPEELVAHADGQAPGHVQAHLRRCAACRAEARGYAAWQTALRRGLHRFDCPPALALGEYQLGVLPAEESRRIAAHAAACPRCAEELRALRSFLAAEPGPASGLAARARRLVARLVPAQLGPATAALRGGRNAQTYQADGIGVALSPAPAGSRSRAGRAGLIGLIWREGAEAAQLAGVAHLVASDGRPHDAPIDDLGNFAFEDLPPGVGQLELRLDDAVVVVEDVQVGG